MDYQFLLSLATSIFLFFLLYCLIQGFQKSNSTEILPPGPWKLPVIGHIHHLIGVLAHQKLRDLAKKHGPILHLQLGQVSAIVVSSPRLAKEILRTNELAFADRPEFLVTKIMFYDKADVGFCPYGDYWRQMRKICVMELLSSKSVQSFRSIREEEVCGLIASIRSSLGQPININSIMFRLTSVITCRAAFGKQTCDQETFIKLIMEAVVFVGGFNLADFFPSFKLLSFITGTKIKLLKMHRKADEILERLIEDHVKNFAATRKGSGEAGGEDLIDVLLRLKESSDLSFPITSRNIKAIIFDVFTAGTEAPAATIEWAMAELIKNPRVMEKAQSEVRQVLKGKDKVYEADIPKLSYLKMVVKETLRLHPPGSLLVPRLSREQCEIDGFKIPTKTTVMVNAWAIARDPEYWDDPESYIPERFDKNSIDFTGNDFVFIPFGAGRRICPGISFSASMMELALAQLLYHFNWELPNGMKPQDLDMSENWGASTRRRHFLHLIATPHIQ